MLKILLPKRLPMAKSIEPILTAATETAISGNEVEAARKKVPTNEEFSPHICAIRFTRKGKARAAIIINNERTIYFLTIVLVGVRVLDELSITRVSG